MKLQAPGRVGEGSFPLYLSQGTLLRPSEVNEVLNDRNDEERRHLKDKWMLCGDASASMVECIEQSNEQAVRSATSVFADHLGGLYVVLTHQVADMQHRFVMPAYEPVVASFLKALGRDKYVVTLGSEGSMRALVLGERLNPGWQRARELAQEEQAHSLLETLAGFGPAVSRIGRLDTLPGLGGQQVNKLNLSVVMPTQAMTLTLKDTTVAH